MRIAPAAFLLLWLSTTLACRSDHDHPHPHAAEDEESWAVTAWGKLYEVFPEVDPLVAGERAMAHTHVTVLDDFSPLTTGSVEIVLRRAGTEQTFVGQTVLRPGIFNVELQPAAEGEYDLAFRIHSAAGDEEIPGGRVRVGTAGDPGGLISGPVESPPAGAAGEPLSFLKEQQWRTRFATGWVREGSLARSLEGVAVVRPVAGGDVRLSAPLAATLDRVPWPFPGQVVQGGVTLFRLRPQVAPERSLAVLEAEVVAGEQELATVQARLARLEELYAVDASSRRDVEETRARVASLSARQEAAERDLAAARAVRSGAVGGEGLPVVAPFPGKVAEVTVSPGETVAAGDVLARLVRTEPVWLEVALTPTDAAALAGSGLAAVRLEPGGNPVTLTGEAVRLVSTGPEVSSTTGTLPVLVEITGAERIPGLVLGRRFQAGLELSERLPGITIPTSALIDDSGVSVVYLQLEGESFARQEVSVTRRQGDTSLVTGLTPGQRLVTVGGAAIRRASLLATGAPEGHVH